MSIGILSELKVVSLRELHKKDCYRSDLPESVHGAKGLVRLAALSVTWIRVPLAVMGILALAEGFPVYASLLFVLFAVTDLLDGVAARRAAADTALRRIGDVVIDRVAIHASFLVACMVYRQGWAVFAMFLVRDVLQGAFSARQILVDKFVVVGRYWHMSYGLSMLLLVCSFVIRGSLSISIVFGTAVISLATFTDYVNRCARLVSSTK